MIQFGTNRTRTCPLSGAKQTSRGRTSMSVNDPTQTLKSVSHYLRIAALMLH
jgi:hypothetical protein